MNQEIKKWTAGNVGFTYLAITGAGYWGKGRTLEEACKNANVGSEPINAMIYRIPNKFVSEVRGGSSAHWIWSETFIKETTEEVRSIISGMCQIESYVKICYKKRRRVVDIIKDYSETAEIPA